MPLEIEQKFAVSDVSDLQERLEDLGAVPSELIHQCDRYFRHPSRNFKETNEALRIRSVGDKNRVTYKGPIIDREVKTREEIEVPFESGESRQCEFATLLERLGFTESRSVRKRRRPHNLTWHGRDMEVVLDEVDELGTFAEIETIADESDRDAARQAVISLAEQLGLTQLERRSYLTMLFEAAGED